MFERGNPYKHTDPTGHEISDLDTFVGPLRSATERGIYNSLSNLLILHAMFTGDNERRDALIAHKIEANEAYFNEIVEGFKPGADILGGMVQVDSEFCEFEASCGKNDLYEPLSYYNDIVDEFKQTLGTSSSGSGLGNFISNRLIDFVHTVFGTQLTPKQAEKVKSGGSAKTSDKETITTVELGGETVYVKITKVK